MQTEILIGKEFPKKVISLIDGASKTLKIIVYDWRWYPNDPGASAQLLNQSIVRAVRRGVRVEAIVNNDSILAVLRENGILAKKINIKGLVHAKLMIIDGKTVVIGSHNYTQAAFELNQELSIVLFDCEDIYKLNVFFDSLWLF